MLKRKIFLQLLSLELIGKLIKKMLKLKNKWNLIVKMGIWKNKISC